MEVTQSLLNMNVVGSSLELISPGNVTEDADLKLLSRWRIGGKCKWLIQPTSIEQVSAIVTFLNKNKVPYIVIGDGSNLLFDSKGLDAVVIKIGRNLSKYSVTGNRVVSEAGVWVPKLARNIARSDLGGIQHTIGIPGTLGGLTCMNGGSQRRGIGDNIIYVTAVMSDGKVVQFNNEECLFDYRESVFQRNGAIIVEVVMEFPSYRYSDSRKEMIDIMRSRRTRFPLKLPNCGSVFVSNPKMYEVIGPPGKAIETCGLKGLSLGGAKISEAHANFIVNVNNATSDDVLGLISLAKETVFKSTNFNMETEVRFVTYDAQIKQAGT
ncbi:UDP-N-acetylmuramate dehydrogenase [Rheinheimera sp.]|uniref:UDP-N-acetylmuramate dehydrogenase n=1 Tax=Rheinheimera sp. TaxID=1869214 RepID=UPI00307EB85B